MKKTTLLFLLALMPSLTNAYDVEINGIYYNLITKAHEAEVASSILYKGDIVIPSTITYNGIEY
ncbi:MAG: hypothetical protein J5543_04520, partial [Bacteroidales bacterium]|nr:hypothetical protein [Bacteroidales bacterium]